MEKYSVLMSVYKNEKVDYFLQSVESMLRQSVMPEQFVIVKDGPLYQELDDCISVYEEANPCLFTVISLPVNGGLGNALNCGIRECRNELIARMDSDDISLPTRCERQLKLFAENPELAIVGTNIDEFYDDPSDVQFSRIVPSDYEGIKKSIGRITPFNHPTVMYKKSEVIRCGGYAKIRQKEDRDLFSRMIGMGCKACNIDESLLLYRANKDNYKRRKSWIYCKSTIDVTIEMWKRKHCSIFDLIYVVIGQIVLFIAPLPLMKWLSDTLLRKKHT